MGDERREHPRYSVALTVEVKDLDALHAFSGVMSNVSLGGAFVEQAEVPEGSRLWVLLMRPDAGPMSLPAVVRHRGRNGIGVQWVSLAAEERQVVQELVWKAMRR